MTKSLKHERLFILGLSRMYELDRRDGIQNKLVIAYKRLENGPRQYRTEYLVEVKTLEELLKDSENRIRLIEEWRVELEEETDEAKYVQEDSRN